MLASTTAPAANVPRWKSLQHRMVLIAAWTSLLMGGAAFAGWLMGIDTLKSLIPGAVQMKANTALGLMLVAVALFARFPRRSGAGKLAQYGLGALIGAMGLATLSEYLFGWNLRIDELLFRDLANAFNAAPGRMSPFSAWTFMVLGAGVAMLGRPRTGWFVQICGLQTAAIGMVSLLGYLWNAAELVTDVWLPPVAVNTALAFMLAGLGMSAAQASLTAGPRGEAVISGLEFKLMLGMGSALVVLVVSAGFTYNSVVEFLYRTEKMGATQQSRVEVQKTLGQASLAVAGYRAGDFDESPSAVRQYLEDLSSSETTLRELLLLSPDAPSLIARVDHLTGLIRAQFTALQAAAGPVSAQERAGATAAAAQANTTLRAEVERMGEFLEASYRTSLAEQTIALEAGRSAMLVSLIVTIGLSVAVFVGLMVSVRREMSRSFMARAEIAELNASLEKRVFERTAELNEAHERFNAFTYSLAHDLRQPLISVGGFGQLLEQRLAQIADTQSKKFLQRIRAAVAHVSVCTDALLELGRVSRAELHLRAVDLTTLTEELVDELRKQDPGNSTEVTVQHGMSAHADGGLLKTAMSHLMANAWKFSSGRPNAHIEVGSSVTHGGGDVWWVKDNGVGFDMAYSQKLFTPFQRLHRADEFAGAGTGLAIIQAVVARHKGRIWVDALPGAGATFYFTLGDVAA